MGKLKQVRNDIAYVMWALGITGWLSVIGSAARRLTRRKDRQPDKSPSPAA